MDNKWTINVGAELKKEEVLPTLKLKDKINDDSDIEIKLSKDKAYIEYELRF